MKKRKQPWSRKTRALFRVLFIFPLLALLVLSRRYGFTEEHALREHEELLGIGPTQIIRDVGVLPVGNLENENITLSGNENVLLMSAQRFNWKNGWESTARVALDCSTELDVMAGYWEFSERVAEPGEEVYYFFGEVADETIQSLRIQLKVGEKEELIWEQEITGRNWIQWNGRRLFLMSWQPEEPVNEPIWRVFELRSADADGTETRHSFYTWAHSNNSVF